MTRCFVGLGSNLGDRLENLEKAASLLGTQTQLLRGSPIVETPALVPLGAADHWRLPFLNTVCEVKWIGSPFEFLQCLKKIERTMGREPGPRWAPRRIDLDILTFGDQCVETPELQIPHPEMHRRQFVLTPLKHLAASLKLPGQKLTVLELSRTLEQPLPLWMGILNRTPDSFSDLPDIRCPEIFCQAWDDLVLENTALIDLGAESTRPGATPLTAAEEWNRLSPILEVISTKRKAGVFRPWLSIDTRHSATAKKALAFGAAVINDVSGLSDPEMLKTLQESNCQYILMHSLSVPADTKIHLNGEDPVTQIKNWAMQKIGILQEAGIHLDRLIFDPGIGFGKTADQSLTLLRRAQEFCDLPVRVLFGHSRKSFISQWSPRPASERDFETLGVSLRLAEKHIDILRVHSPDLHQRMWRSYQEAE